MITAGLISRLLERQVQLVVGWTGRPLADGLPIACVKLGWACFRSQAGDWRQARVEQAVAKAHAGGLAGSGRPPTGPPTTVRQALEVVESHGLPAGRQGRWAGAGKGVHRGPNSLATNPAGPLEDIF